MQEKHHSRAGSCLEISPMDFSMMSKLWISSSPQSHGGSLSHLRVHTHSSLGTGGGTVGRDGAYGGSGSSDHPQS